MFRLVVSGFIVGSVSGLALVGCSNDVVLPGDSAAGDTVATDTSAGDASAGDTSAGDTTSGDTASGDAAPDGTASDDTSSGDTAADTEPADTPGVDWATLHYPAEHTGEVGESLMVYGRVYEAGVTDGAGEGVGVIAEVGVGAAGDAVESWSWTAAAYNVDVDTANDEYESEITLSTAGSWRFAYRFKLAGDQDWKYADLDGTDNGFDVSNAGVLTVTAAPPAVVDWCNLQHPAAIVAAPGASSGDIYGRVFEPGVSDSDAATAQLVGALGWGLASEDPASQWTWSPAVFDANVDADANDEFVASFTVPSEAGQWRYAYRFRLATGTDWVQCDLDGVDGVDSGGAGNSFDMAKTGELTVQAPAGPVVDWCITQWPMSVTFAQGAAGESVYGQVFEPGVTGEGGAATPAVLAQVGWGPDGSNPETGQDVGAGWTWSDGTFNGYKDNGFGVLANDEYMATLAGASQGTWDWAWRFSIDAGTTWMFCDQAGSQPYAPDQAAELIVTGP